MSSLKHCCIQLIESVYSNRIMCDGWLNIIIRPRPGVSRHIAANHQPANKKRLTHHGKPFGYMARPTGFCL